jgi:glycosyltransferase involved in cell wall biosynthesis
METARRMARSLPAPIRARLRDLLAWLYRLRAAPRVEDWSTPLIGKHPGSEAPPHGPTGAAAAVAGPDVTESAPADTPVRVSAADLPVLRCLLVTCALDVGGLAGVVAFLARRLPAHQLQTAVLHTRSDRPAPREPGRLSRMLRSNGIEVHEADESGAQAWIERWRPDVISAHHAPGWVLATAQRVGVPYIDNLHGMHDLFGADRQAEAVRGAQLAAIVAVSDLVRQQYLARNPDFPPGRIVAIPNGVDDERQPRGDRAVARDRLGLTDEYLFVSLARHCLQKNPYGLVCAFGELAKRRPEAHLVLAGRLNEDPYYRWDDLRYFRQVMRLRDRLPCRDRIHLREHLAAPNALLAAADGFVLDSFFEGWSLASMEALFAGLPVVLSDVGGAREQIGGDPARGYLVPNPLGDPLAVDWGSIGAAQYRQQPNREEFATAMERLIAHREQYLHNREQLAAESARRFRADDCLARHAAVLRSVAVGASLEAVSLSAQPSEL